MANQKPEDKQDRQPGTHDVTKAEEKQVEQQKPTTWDLLNNHGEY